jgi:hypothetical protein
MQGIQKGGIIRRGGLSTHLFFPLVFVLHIDTQQTKKMKEKRPHNSTRDFSNSSRIQSLSTFFPHFFIVFIVCYSKKEKTRKRESGKNRKSDI